MTDEHKDAQPADSPGVPSPRKRTGRRAGSPQTREAILESARKLFAAKGFAASSMRQIAADAGVDAALVHHYFGSKDQLFLASAQVDVDVPTKIAEVLDGDVADFGTALVRTIVLAWDSDAQSGLLAAFRSALTDHAASRMLIEFLGAKVLGRLASRLPYPAAESERRVGLVASQIVGLLTARYLLRLQPLCDMPADDIVRAVGPAVQRYLTGDLSGM